MTDSTTAARATADPVTPGPRGTWLVALFCMTAFMAAALLFMVQPLAARLILPAFGGSATVWSTSSLFFQVLLLLGYVYAHLTTTRLGAWWQPRTHLLVLLVPLVALPITVPGGVAPDSGTNPVTWLLWILTAMVGLPFVVLSATGPLIQRWYSWSGGPRAEDPYFLFAGSNLGSFVGLLAYPFLVEPQLSLSSQRLWWSIAFGVLLVLVAACALSVRANRGTARVEHQTAGASRPSTGSVAYWTALAFLPSCLMLAVTAHLSTDIAAIPLLWVVPLAAYLATFVAAFARTGRELPILATRLAIASAVVAGTISVAAMDLPLALVLGVDVLALVMVGYAAHARLAATRPEPGQLTAFYLVISVGGALGGLVNGVVAPLLFNRVWEYGLTLALVPLLLGVTGPGKGTVERLASRYHPVFRAVLGGIALTILLIALAFALAATDDRPVLWLVVVLLLVSLAAWWSARWRIGLTIGLSGLALLVGTQAAVTSLEMDRTFYGSYRVTAQGELHTLVHGTTVHGTQFQSDELRSEPTTYYDRSGPLGSLIETVDPSRVGVVGLGAGAIAAYDSPERTFTFYEIDPLVVDLAEDDRYFTYLSDSESEIEVVTGDGRLALHEAPKGAYDLLVLDAFSSDSIPVHLLTREAFSEYASRLTEDGVLMVHISNRVFNLTPVLAAAADHLGWHAHESYGNGRGRGATESRWVALTAHNPTARDLTHHNGWQTLSSTEKVVWTDDYSSVLDVLR